ncbi:sodium:proton antiporter, partial [Megasphaera massiliensis]|uniref:sodium:proton antiporter n=1 Tax=Megasphaera massiliensis TaxID=1232428 RepID=UPI00210A5394
PILLLNLVIKYAIIAQMDKHFYNKQKKEGRSPHDAIAAGSKEPIRLEGAHNLIFIAMIIIGVLANGLLPEMQPFFANGAGIHIYDEIVFPYAT